MLFPDLKIGITSAIFNSFGNIPFLKDRLIMCVSGVIYKYIYSFAIFAGMPSYPELLFFRDIMVLITSSSVNSGIYIYTILAPFYVI